MSTKIVIREASLKEAVKVHNNVLEFESEHDETYFSNRLAKHARLVLLASVDGKPAGYMIGYDRDHDGSFYCWMTGVDPRYRRMGIVRQLMLYLESWAKLHEYSSLKLKVHKGRSPMLQNLTTSDFSVVSKDPDAPDDHFIYFEKQFQ
jgi:ribosomal protein S18 acetylase RimI-like enzyme